MKISMHWNLAQSARVSHLLPQECYATTTNPQWPIFLLLSPQVSQVVLLIWAGLRGAHPRVYSQQWAHLVTLLISAGLLHAWGLSWDNWAVSALLHMVSHPTKGYPSFFSWGRSRVPRKRAEAHTRLLQLRPRTATTALPPYSISQSRLQGQPTLKSWGRCSKVLLQWEG